MTHRLDVDALPASIARARRILIVRLSSIGDVVHTLPLLTALREAAPQAEVSWLVQASIAPLIEPVVRTLPFDRAHPWRSLPTLRRRLRDFAPEVTLDLQGNTKSAVLAASSGASLRIGLHADDCREWPNALLSTHCFPKMSSQHAVERTLESARWLGASGIPSFELGFTREERSAAQDALDALGIPQEGPVVCLNAGRTTDLRSWPLDRQTALAIELAGRGHTVLIQGGPAEEADSPAWRAALNGRPRIHLALGSWRLRLLGAVYSVLAERHHLVVGGDSGPLHLAAATGARTLGWYGPQDPERTGPYGPRASVLLADTALPCRPCLRRRCHFERPVACLRDLTVARVADRIEARISES
ncbi:MAG: glycosyltransferase family 9 protein [Planctomycetota bacterium]